MTKEDLRQAMHILSGLGMSLLTPMRNPDTERGYRLVMHAWTYLSYEREKLDA